MSVLGKCQSPLDLLFFLHVCPQAVFGDRQGWARWTLGLVQTRHLYILMAFNWPPSARQGQEILQMSYTTRELLWLPKGALFVLFQWLQ